MVCFGMMVPAQSQGPAFTPADYVGAANGVSTIGAITIATLEHRVFDLVNNERNKNGRPSLLWVDQVATIARYHSTNMANDGFLGHEDRNGRRPSQRADLLGLRDWRQIGENIAWISGREDPAKRVVECWMQSPGHRQNLLDPSYRESGIGLALTADGKYYFTQVFILRK